MPLIVYGTTPSLFLPIPHFCFAEIFSWRSCPLHGSSDNTSCSPPLSEPSHLVHFLSYPSFQKHFPQVFSRFPPHYDYAESLHLTRSRPTFSFRRHAVLSPADADTLHGSGCRFNVCSFFRQNHLPSSQDCLMWSCIPPLVPPKDSF